MAKFGTSSASVNFSNQAVTSTTAKTKGWMATGYLNLFMTMGGTFKLGAVALTVGNEQHVELFQSLMTDRKAPVLTNILNQMVLDFNPHNPNGVDMGEFAGMDDYEEAEVDPEAKEQALGYININIPCDGGELSKLGYISLMDSDANQRKVFHALNKPGDDGINNLKLVKARLSATFYATQLGNSMVGGGAKSGTKVSYLALKAA